MVTSNFVPINQVASRSEILFHSPSTKLFVDGLELGTGILHVTESNVIWSNRLTSINNPVRRVSLLHHTISFYGIQREAVPALYMVINYELRSVIPELPQTNNSNEDEDFDPEDQPITELRFIPETESELGDLHSALDEGQALHPDPADEVYDEDDFEADIFEVEDPFAENMDAEFRMGQLHLDTEGAQHHMEEHEDDEDRGR